MEAKILIVGTLPYFKGAQSREFGTYLSKIEQNSLKQIYITSSLPVKGPCCELFQLTDSVVLKRRIQKKKDGHIYLNETLPDEDERHLFKTNDGKFVKIVKKNNDIKRLIRNFIWKEKYWKTPKLLKWVDDYKPNIIYLSWTNDCCLLDMALFFSKKYNANIIVSITDDYLLIKRHSCGFYGAYFKKYKQIALSILQNKNNRVFYIDEKIRDKYKEEFGIFGEVIHIGTPKSNVLLSSRDTEQIKTFFYFGSLAFDRYRTIFELGSIVDDLHLPIKINVYSQNATKRMKRLFLKIKSIIINEPIPYDLIKSRITNKSAILLVESLSDTKSIENVRYSLSTKVADSISYGKPVIAIGHKETGLMSFVLRNKFCLYATNKKELKELVVNISNNKIDYSECWSNSYNCITNDFDIDLNGNKFKKLVESMIQNGGKNE